MLQPNDDDLLTDVPSPAQRVNEDLASNSDSEEEEILTDSRYRNTGGYHFKSMNILINFILAAATIVQSSMPISTSNSDSGM